MLGKTMIDFEGKRKLMDRGRAIKMLFRIVVRDSLMYKVRTTMGKRKLKFKAFAP